MTISYSDTFAKLLLKWNGSLWKSIWRHLVIYLFCYYCINLVYRLLLNDSQKLMFLQIVDFCDESSNYIPLNFVLGFFVSSILARWWMQCNYISYPDSAMILITTYIQGEQYLVLRRTMARWLNLSVVLCWKTICSRTLKRFPTNQHIVVAGMMTEEELKTYEALEGPHGKWFLPLQWLNNLLDKCRTHKIIDSIQLKQIIKEVYKYRMGMVMLKLFEWIAIPLAYTQVVAIATYGYFAITLFSRQTTGRSDKQEPDIIVPFFTILQLLFYLGWFKVGEDLINPLGDDDDDFELNYVLDRNVQVAYLLADQINGQLPPLEKDLFWGRSNPMLAHTRGSLRKRDKIFAGHLHNFKVSEKEQLLADDVVSKSEDELDHEGEPTERSALLKFGRLIRGMRKKRQAADIEEEEEPEKDDESQQKPESSDHIDHDTGESEGGHGDDPQSKIDKKVQIKGAKARKASAESSDRSMHFTFTEDES